MVSAAIATLRYTGTPKARARRTEEMSLEYRDLRLSEMFAEIGRFIAPAIIKNKWFMVNGI
jgi:hypothetical protein